MTAEIIAVGTEILMGQIADTNSQALGKLLPEFGISHHFRQTVGDNLARLTAALELALSRSDIVFTIGGLGPTEDDLTREAISAAIHSPLAIDETAAEKLRRLFAQRNLPWLESQLKQAQLPEGAEWIANPNGSAAGIFWSGSGKQVFALPGPKSEFVPMIHGPVRAKLEEIAGVGRIFSRILKVAGMGESMVEEAIRDLIQGANPSVGIYAHPGEVQLRLTAHAGTHVEAQALVAPLEVEVRERLKTHVFGVDDDTLASAILEKLRSKSQSVAVAESCTGGLLGAAYTGVAGSSDVFVGGVISYQNKVKHEQLGVSSETLDQYGAVSEQTAREMAEGARKLLHTDWALSITGIAGPGGGSPEKPVGLVYTACAGPSQTVVQKHQFRGIREFIRQRSVMASLTQLWDQLA